MREEDLKNWVIEEDDEFFIKSNKMMKHSIDYGMMVTSNSAVDSGSYIKIQTYKNLYSSYEDFYEEMEDNKYEYEYLGNIEPVPSQTDSQKDSFAVGECINIPAGFERCFAATLRQSSEKEFVLGSKVTVEEPLNVEILHRQFVQQSDITGVHVFFENEDGFMVAVPLGYNLIEANGDDLS